MNDADIKLQLIRLIDKQHGRKLLDLYELIQSKLSVSEDNNLEPMELGYKEMSEDVERETTAFEWIEGANDYVEI